jgi:pyruvate dehydrogenase phosphatase
MSVLRTAWKPLVGGLAVVGGSAYYFTRPATFELPIKLAGPDGKSQMSTKTLPLLPMQTINERLRKDSTSETVSRPYGITWKHTTASLPSNDPIEDAHSHQIIERDDALSSKMPGDYLFFNVFDGHRGPETSRLLSRVLINAVALELTQVAYSAEAITGKSFTNKLFGTSTSSSQTDVASIIENAFTKLDSLLMDAPISFLQNHLKERSSKDMSIPDLSKDPQGMAAMMSAISGE